MKQIRGINHLGLRVSNLATARAFYEKLGFDFIVGPVGPEPVAIMEHPSGVNINFILNAAEPAKENILRPQHKVMSEAKIRQKFTKRRSVWFIHEYFE